MYPVHTPEISCADRQIGKKKRIEIVILIKSRFFRINKGLR